MEENKKKLKDQFPGQAPIADSRKRRFQRGSTLNTQGIRDKKLKGMLDKHEKKYQNSLNQAARNDILMTEDVGFLETEEGEESWQIKQSEIKKAVDISSASKQFELNLRQFGPYNTDYTRNGRHLLLGGKRGHIVAVEWFSKQLMCEVNVMEAVHDVKWLHSENMFAVAQKRWTYIYDNQGIELHCLKSLNETLRMEFLPYHFLLATASRRSYLQYLDISMGKIVSTIKTKFGPLNVMTHNPNNAIITLGHRNGTISMWSPNEPKPLVNMLCHRTSVTAVAIDQQGRYLATAGNDRKMKIFDVRTFKPLQDYSLKGVATDLKFSQRGLLATACQRVVEVFKDPCSQTQESPYLRHNLTGLVHDINFCPYEDVLGVGWSNGFVSMLVPGAGEANFDSFEANPHRNKKQRREWEVKALLEKIPPELITLDCHQVAKFDEATAQQLQEDREKVMGFKAEPPKFVPRKRAKGRSKSGNVEKRKLKEIEKKRRDTTRAALQAKAEKSEVETVEDAVVEEPDLIETSVAQDVDSEVPEIKDVVPEKQPEVEEKSLRKNTGALNRFKRK